MAVGVVILFTGAILFTVAAEYFGLGRNYVFKTSTPGPGRGEASVMQQFPFFVRADEVGIDNRIEVTPRPKSEQKAAGTVELSLAVLDPAGKLLFEEKKVLTTQGGGIWNSMIRDFQPSVKGSYQMRLVIPQPVGAVEVQVGPLR